MLLNNARDDLLSKWQEPVRPWEATAPSAPWEEPPPSWAGLGVCLTCLACLGSLDCLARFSKRHARRPDPTQSESAGYRWLSLTCSCLARTWPFLWSVLTLLVAPVVSIYGLWMWVSDKRQRAQRAATVRAVRTLRARAFAAGQRGAASAATPGQKTRAGRSQRAMAHSVERFCRMWSVILAARRHISLLKCRRALATLTARFRFYRRAIQVRLQWASCQAPALAARPGPVSGPISLHASRASNPSPTPTPPLPDLYFLSLICTL